LNELYKIDNWILEKMNLKNEYFFLHTLFKNLKLNKNKYNLVVIPYQNPQKSKISINYFEALHTQLINLPNNNINQEIYFTNTISKSEYLTKIRHLKQQIQLGNIYEINYCTQFKALAKDLDIFSVFNNLVKLSNVPYNYLIKIKNEFILCCSPELFLKKENNYLITKPIKGTIKRGETITKDEELKTQLSNSLKDKIEHVMAVDVARNDLSVIAEKGSVNVDKLYAIESFKTVHQMVTTVNCKINNKINFETIIDATFPMASMTGAPKQSAMNLIDESELFSRKYYSGTFGFIKPNGDFELPVVIRSLFYNSETNELSFSVGGAITNLSNPEQELEECLLKAQTMLNAVNAKLIWD
jgi:para-aminobenzoate synthetase component 1